MLTNAHPGQIPDMTGAILPISEVSFPMPFASVLEYNAPARGPWNIVHTGMLLPGAHQIFACAQGCLRGVILTAAEMNAMNRMSWIGVCENDMIDGSMEGNIIEGTSEILHKLPERPPAVLLFISCIHQFAACDFDAVIGELKERFPAVDFVKCYMNPTMRKSGLTPDQLMRRQLYAPLAPVPEDPRTVNLIGNDFPTDATSELGKLIAAAGDTLRDLTLCRSYAEYRKMAASFLNITTIPAAKEAGKVLSERLGRKHLHLPLSYRADEILRNLELLAQTLGVPSPDCSEARARADRALKHAREVLGETPIEIDYTATSRPVGLAKLLTEHGFTVRKLYLDAMIEEEREDFLKLRETAPELLFVSTLHPKMRFAGKGALENGSVLAIGQKAAYFSGTRRFVNMVAGGGMYGFDGIAHLAEKIVDAFQNEKETEHVIQFKGLGCESCL